jgi:integrase
MVPIHPTTKAIFEKYDFNFPKPISNQKFNEYLKDICKLARIDAAHTKKRTIGGIETDETAPKYEFISSHTARRSFATNLYNADFPTLDIMKITGHKTEKAFMRYIKITKKDAAQKLARRWAHDEQTIKMYG